MPHSRIVSNFGQIQQGNTILPYYNLSGGAGIADGDYGDISVSGGGTVLTIDPNAVTDSKLRQSNPTSVIGRQFNSAGDPADIVALSGFGAPALLHYSFTDNFLYFRYFHGPGVLKSNGGDIIEDVVRASDLSPELLIAGGDLGGSYPNPEVRELDNATAFQELQDDFNSLLLWVVETFGQIPPSLEDRFEQAVNAA